MAQVVVTMTKNIGNNDPKPRGWVDTAIDSHYDPMSFLQKNEGSLLQLITNPKVEPKLPIG